jgi:signal transduction histidine kinase/DNA-binding response OmpR family regulator
VRYPAFEQGYETVVLLLQYLEGQVEDHETVRIPTQLIVRGSCGCLSGIPTVEHLESLTLRHLQSGATVVSVKPTDQRGQKMGVQMARVMASKMIRQGLRSSPEEVHHACRRLVEAFMVSLGRGDSMDFHLAMQQVLRRAIDLGDDPHVWQVTVSTLRDNVPAVLGRSPDPLVSRWAEVMLDQARLAIAEATREQYTRHLVRQVNIADQVGQMVARFLAARDEAGIFSALLEDLPSVGIRHAAVALYEPEGKDPMAWSVLQAPSPTTESLRFPSRQFPPQGLYREDEPFSLALLPLLIRDDASGFVAFDTGNLEMCADIVRQLTAALRGVWLYREAVEARQSAEEGKRLAEEANRLKSRFLSVVSHELRTPLNLICGLSDMLLREGKRTGPNEFRVSRGDLERIYVGAQHLDSLIRDVLDLGRSEVGQLKLLREPLDLTEVLEAASEIGEQLAQDKDLAWRVEIPKNLPRVWGDRARLRQVTLNLVSNAVKFTARGEIALSASVDDEHVTVRVQDTGLGIPVEEREAIFDEFRQSKRTTARGYGGLGLGLAICKRLVEMHGGKIGVYSPGEQGGGSTFYFTLPVMKRQDAFPSVEVLSTGAERVLLLAKDIAGEDLLRQRLTQQGLEVEVHQSNETMDWLTHLMLSPPNMVALDLGLASEQGWEVLKLLKENPATQDIPVLFYTLATDQEGGGFLEMDYLTKPMGSAELASTLASRGLLECDESATKRILVVDDEPSMLEMHARIVQMQFPSCQVLRARNGREALKVIRAERPDLVLLDLMMPEMDGFGVLEAMQEDEANCDVPVVVLTGQVLTEEDIARLNRGVVSVLGKGLFSVEETLERIEAALMRRQRLGMGIQQIVRRAMGYIHEHYAEPISRDDVARHVGFSVRHLTRCFRQEVGVTPITYLNRYRVRQAKGLLKAREKSITEIALEVGFSSSGYFARVFRQEMGVSPSAYRQGEQAAGDYQ